ncbi:hypothetical protein [Vibrio rumoiensis]|uniref:MSHA biogenesis protein MshF n=1 Tax=Vibrio rumoiensis 1S-45 TaxID=1188252 RepID=A0A1E5E564_9VIBR|nr:hypothetical protein [Vibrio rumoiensis]OEF28471.1 hypothetical protein A1QC_05415 [Vibrio rumoiensis 1S-45]
MDTRKRLRFFIWCTVVFIIMASWLYVWKEKTEPASERAAFVVAKRQILNSANTYRQNWLLNKQPSMMGVDGVDIQFTKQGWPVMLKNDRIDCAKWLSLLWPDENVFGKKYSVIDMRDDSKLTSCEYIFTGGVVLDLHLINMAFGAEVNYP